MAAGSTVNNLNKDLVSNAVVNVPNKAEQNKIGRVLENIDGAITLHQRKLEKLKNFRKAMLEKMFPKNGKKTPEIRFQGFADDWEQRKLGEIVNKAVDNRGKTPPISDKGTHPLIEVACLGNGFPDYSKIKKYLDDITFKSMLREYTALYNFYAASVVTETSLHKA